MKKLLILTVVILISLIACKNTPNADNYKQEVVVVNKIPKGSYANEEISDRYLYPGWYMIGLSRNGEEPVEYYLRAESIGPDNYLMSLEIGDRGIVYIKSGFLKDNGMKLPAPNAKNPPNIGALGEIIWKEITVPNTPTTIGDLAFYNMKLKKINISNNITAIGDQAFAGCQLTEVIIPDSVTFIGEYAFVMNPLNKITIGANVDIKDFGLPHKFNKFYLANNRIAGTYNYINGQWILD